jgi:predicted nucleic acid-binding Zn ribbon protein
MCLVGYHHVHCKRCCNYMTKRQVPDKPEYHYNDCSCTEVRDVVVGNIDSTHLCTRCKLLRKLRINEHTDILGVMTQNYTDAELEAIIDLGGDDEITRWLADEEPLSHPERIRRETVYERLKDRFHLEYPIRDDKKEDASILRGRRPSDVSGVISWEDMDRSDTVATEGISTKYPRRNRRSTFNELSVRDYLRSASDDDATASDAEKTETESRWTRRRNKKEKDKAT